jgi:tetratricopeptide (TPR) repeat protein
MYDLGYALMNASRVQGALTIFRLNAELYPNGYNSFDSLGECLVKLNRNDEAIAAYQTALQLNPGHTDGANSIEALRSGN